MNTIATLNIFCLSNITCINFDITYYLLPIIYSDNILQLVTATGTVTRYNRYGLDPFISVSCNIQYELNVYEDGETAEQEERCFVSNSSIMLVHIRSSAEIWFHSVSDIENKKPIDIFRKLQVHPNSRYLIIPVLPNP